MSPKVELTVRKEATRYLPSVQFRANSEMFVPSNGSRWRETPPTPFRQFILLIYSQSFRENGKAQTTIVFQTDQRYSLSDYRRDPERNTCSECESKGTRCCLTRTSALTPHSQGLSHFRVSLCQSVHARHALFKGISLDSDCMEVYPATCSWKFIPVAD